MKESLCLPMGQFPVFLQKSRYSFYVVSSWELNTKMYKHASIYWSSFGCGGGDVKWLIDAYTDLLNSGSWYGDTERSVSLWLLTAFISIYWVPSAATLCEAIEVNKVLFSLCNYCIPLDVGYLQCRSSLVNKLMPWCAWLLSFALEISRLRS